MLEPETAAEVLIKAGRGDKPDYHDSGLLAGQTSGAGSKYEESVSLGFRYSAGCDGLEGVFRQTRRPCPRLL